MRHAKAKRQSYKWMFLVLLLLPFALVLWPNASSAHEPITTKILFNKDVVRIFKRNCLGCHHPGGIAPWSLVTYEEARPWAKAIKEELLEQRMPPWHLMKGYGDFSNAPALTQRDIDMIVNWVEGGAPPGKLELLPKEPLVSTDWQLGEPDLVLKAEAAHKVASDADEYCDIDLQAKLTEDRWVTAVDVQPGNGSVVHCATIYVEPEKGPRYTLGTWMPGQRTVRLPEGTAQLIPSGARVNLKVHYHGAGEDTEDLSAVGLYFADSQVQKQTREVEVTNSNAVIPTGSTPQRVKAEYTLEDAAEAVAVRPSVNPLVISLQATAYRPDGTEEVLVWTRGYKFDWQPTYIYKQPVALPKGTRIEVIAYFDNSETNSNNPNTPPKEVRWSEVSSQSLCAVLVATNLNNKDVAGRR